MFVAVLSVEGSDGVNEVKLVQPSNICVDVSRFDGKAAVNYARLVQFLNM